MKKPLVLILGNQLFPWSHLEPFKDFDFFMAEDQGLCTYEKHHQQKIVLFLTAMRDYRDSLKKKGAKVTYKTLESRKDGWDYEDVLREALKDRPKLISFEIEDKFFERRIGALCEDLGIPWDIIPSPMFLTSREQFRSYLDGTKSPFMKVFYEKQRKHLGVLIDQAGEPVGGKWSLDSENRKKMPKSVEPPEDFVTRSKSKNLADVLTLVQERFSKHPGNLKNFVWPTSREGYLEILNTFFIERFKDFGSYQDSLSEKTPFLYHSLLSPGLNLGLITPDEVLEGAIAVFEKDESEIPLNSMEGFVRQLIGWREFIRGIYREFSDKQETTNFWGHKRQLTAAWYDGTTGIPPVDSAIKKCNDYGYGHHIERLMVLSNIMLLCEIDPKNVHSWFMEMFVDSSDWVMGPNVYGMGQFSDGGVFATKPYICGSNYIRKMSDYKKGDWCDVMDGLYWRFVDKNRTFFSKNPRLKMMMGSLDRMDGEKRDRIFGAANAFIEDFTKIS